MEKLCKWDLRQYATNVYITRMQASLRSIYTNKLQSRIFSIIPYADL